MLTRTAARAEQQTVKLITMQQLWSSHSPTRFWQKGDISLQNTDVYVYV